jgi:starvation-inducible DNA-binding protein
MKTSTPPKGTRRAAHPTGQRAHEIQAFGTVVSMPIALAEGTRRVSADNLNQLLADTFTLRDLYKKHHWQVSGPTFYQLHLLFDKHFGEQNELVDLIAERIMQLGGVSIAMSADVAEMTLIPRPPKGREEVPVQLSRRLRRPPQTRSRRPCGAIGPPRSGCGCGPRNRRCSRSGASTISISSPRVRRLFGEITPTRSYGCSIWDASRWKRTSRRSPSREAVSCEDGDLLNHLAI